MLPLDIGRIPQVSHAVLVKHPLEAPPSCLVFSNSLYTRWSASADASNDVATSYRRCRHIDVDLHRFPGHLRERQNPVHPTNPVANIPVPLVPQVEPPLVSNVVLGILALPALRVFKILKIPAGQPKREGVCRWSRYPPYLQNR